MSLSDLASLGSFISGLAILVSLILLYFQLRQVNQQVRQAEKNQQAVIRQTRSMRAAENTLRAMEPSFAEVFEDGRFGSEGLSQTALRQFGSFWRGVFIGWEDAFSQHLDGLFSESAFGAFTVYVRNTMSYIGTRAQWRIHRTAFAPEFVAWMDALVAETPIAGPVGVMTRWREALAAERAHAPY